MGIVAAYAVPHPPLIVPAVGRGQEQAIARTIASFNEVARRTAAHRPDLIVIASPHAPLFRDGFFVSDARGETGSLASFGQPQETIGTVGNPKFARKVMETAEARGIPTIGNGAVREPLDHATFVPLHFLEKAVDLNRVPVVRIGLSGLPGADHEALGRIIAAAAEEQGQRTVFIASGDWSHRLKEDGPYGFAPEGPRFDDALKRIFAAGTLSDLFSLDPALCDGAGECGLRSFEIMAGALEGTPYTSEMLSYEGPFGVGYGVAAFEVQRAAASTEEEADAEILLSERRETERAGAGASLPKSPGTGVRGGNGDGHSAEDRSSGEAGAYAGAEAAFDRLVAEGADPLVALARVTVDAFVRTGRTPDVPATMPEEAKNRRAGTFVSLHEHDNLRGCIGTIQATTDSIAQEVIRNAVAACSEDPRFPAVAPEELGELSYSVDVLGEAEPVASLEQLDPARYGVIVSKGWRRGLLLPDLEGVDTVEQQLAIAMGKGGISPDEPVSVERFEVVRHSIGGAPAFPKGR